MKTFNMNEIHRLMQEVYPQSDCVYITLEFESIPAVVHADGHTYVGSEYVRTFIQNGLRYRRLNDAYFLMRENLMEIGVVVHRDLYYTQHCIGSVMQHVKYKRMTIRHQQ